MTFCRLILLASDKLARKQEGRQIGKSISFGTG